MVESNAKAMTHGSPIKVIMNFALPLLLGNLFQQTYNIADAAIVGKCLGSNALGAVGVSSSIQFMIFGFVLGITCGFAIPIANSFGAKKEKEMRQYVYIGAVLTTIIAIVVTILCALNVDGIMRMIKTPEELFQEGRTYLLIIFLGMPCTLFYNYLAAVIRAIGDSKTPTIFLVISSIINIVLDYFLIVPVGMGVAGAAIATISSQLVSGIMCYILIKRKVTLLQLREEDRVMDKKMAMHLLNMGVPFSFQMSLTAFGTMVLQAANNGLNSIVYVTGFTAASKIRQFMIAPFDAFAASITTYCSQNYGANEIDRIKEGIRKLTVVVLLFSLFVAVLFYFCGEQLSLIFISKDDPDMVAVLQASAKILAWSGAGFFTLGLEICLRAAAQGIGFSHQAMISGLIDMIGRIFIALAFVPTKGFLAVCIADPFAWLVGMIYVIPMTYFAVRKVEREHLQLASACQ